MKINTIEIHNVLCFESANISLNTFNLVIGPNGSGKSTIIDSIPLALFKKSYRTNKLSSLANDKELDSYIRLEFQYNNDIFVITRYFGKKGQDVIVKNGNVIGTGTTSCNTIVNDIIPQDIFLHIIGLQRRLTDILSNSIVKLVIQKAYNIEKAQLVNKSLDRVIRNLTTELNVKTEMLYDLKKEVNETEIESLRNTCIAKKHESGQILSKINELDDEIEQTNKKIRDLKTSIQQLEEELSILKSVDENLIEAYNFIKDIELDKYKQKIQFLSNLLLRHDIQRILKLFNSDQERILEKVNNLSQSIDNVYKFKQFTNHNAQAYSTLHELYKRYHKIPLNLLVSNNQQLDKTYIINVAKDCIVYIGSKLQRKTYQPRYTIREYEYMLHNLDELDSQYMIDVHLTNIEKSILKQFKSWDEVHEWLMNFENHVQELVKTLTYTGVKAKQKHIQLLQSIYELVKQIHQHFKSKEEILFVNRIITYIQLIKRHFSNLNDFMTHLSKYETSELASIEDELKRLRCDLDDANHTYNNLVSKKNDLLNTLNKIKDEYLHAKHRLGMLEEKLKQIKTIEDDISNIIKQLELSRSYKRVIENYNQHITNMI